MRSISNAFRSRLYEDDYRNYLERVQITFANGEHDPLTLTESKLWNGGIEIDTAVSSDNSLDIGSAIVGQCRIIIENLDGAYSSFSFIGAKVVPSVGLTLANGQNEFVKLGEYYVVDEHFDVSCVTLTCYDAMSKFDKTIESSNLDYSKSVTLNNIVTDACSICGVPLASGTSLPHGSYAVSVKPDETTTTFRELIAWACQICGVNARINVNGQLEFIWYNSAELQRIRNGNKTSASHSISSIFGAPSVSLNDVVVTQISVSEKIKDEAGNESTIRRVRGYSGYTISIEENPLVQGNNGMNIANWLYDDLNGFRFRKASFSCLSDPSIEAGDVAELIDRKGNHYAIIISGTKFKVTQQQTVRSSAADPERTVSQRTSQVVKNYVGAMASIAEERAARRTSEASIIENLQANHADIEDLKADYATVGALSADYAALKNAAVGQLDAAGATVGNLIASSLHADSAVITNLTANYANINTILNGNEYTDNLQAIKLTAQNAQVTEAFVKSIIAAHLTAGEIKSGKINTDLVEIGDTDGALTIQGNTLQIKDGNDVVRIQIGQDAQGGFTFTIFDSTGAGVLIDSTGIKANALADDLIKARMIDDGQISNAHVANNANIAGSKLNIASVISAINSNNTETIKSSKIYVDAEGQTADLLFTAITDDVETNSTAISVANGKIDKLISQSEIDSLPSGYTTMYSALNHVSEDLSGTKQTVSQLQSKVNDNTGDIEEMDSRLGTYEQTLTNFKSEVSSTYVTKTTYEPVAEKINNLEVGGRNYYIIKDSSSGYLSTSISSLSAASSSRKERTSDFIAVAPGEKLTMQVWATPASDQQLWIAYMFCQSDKETAVGSRVAKYGTANETYLAYINIEVPANAAYVRVSARMWSDGRMKVEKSSIPTDWSPAPEDTDSAISAVDTAAQNYASAAQQAAINDTTTRLASYATTESVQAGISGSEESVKQYVSNTYTEKATYETFVSDVANTYATQNALSQLQTQVDGQIETWFYAVPPTASVPPENTWTSSALKDQHVGDLYYNTATGLAYRYTKSGSTYSWASVGDSAVSKALSDAAAAQATADGKMRVFYAQPTTEQAYDVGDIWVNATYGSTYSNDLLRCKTAKAAGSAFNIGHWGLATKYTDDTAATNALANAKTYADGVAADAEDNAKDYTTTQLAAYTKTENLEAYIETKKDKITSLVSDTYVTQTTYNVVADKINNLEVGGRNLFENTLNPVVTPAAKRPRIIGQTTDTYCNTGTCTTAPHGMRITNSGASRTQIRFGSATVSTATLNGLEAGKTYTLSFDAKWRVLSGTAETAIRYMEASLYDNSGSETALARTAYERFGTVEAADRGTDMEGRCEFTFTVPANATKLYILIANNRTTNSNYAAGDYIELSNMKLEKGSMATDWSPAPEDTDSAISAVDAAAQGYASTAESNAKNYTDTNYQSTRSWVEQNKDSITSTVSYIQADSSQYDTLQELLNNSKTEVVVGTQTSATASWTGTASFSSLTDGKAIIYWLPKDSKENVTLNLALSGGTSTGAIPVYFSGTTRLGTEYPAGSQIRLVYRQNATVGSSTLTGWWAESYINTDTLDRMQYKASVMSGAAITAGRIGVFNTSGRLIALSTTPFDVTKPILYVKTAYGANGATSTDNYISWGDPFDLTATHAITGASARASVYIVGTLDGTTFTPDSTVLTCTKPTTADGKIYMLLGLMSTATMAVLAPEHPMYKFVNGAFKSLNQVAYEAQDDVDNIDVGGTNLIRNTYAPKAEDFGSKSYINFNANSLTLYPSSGPSWIKTNSTYLPYADYKNDIYTLSFEGRQIESDLSYTPSYEKDSVNNKLEVKIGAIKLDYVKHGDDSNYEKYKLFGASVNNPEWAKYSFAVSIPDDLTYGGYNIVEGDSCVFVYISKRMYAWPFEIRNIKLERGNVATAWSPAPEDAQAYTDAQLTVAKSEIKQTTDSISLTVTANTNAINGKMDADVDGSVLISKINLTPEEVAIQADKINLNGAITANDAFKINKDGTMVAAKGGRISNFVFNDTAMKYHVLAASLSGLNILQGSNNLTVASNSVWADGTYRKSGTGNIVVSNPPSLPSGVPSSVKCARITATAVNAQCGFCQDGAALLDHEVTLSVYVKGTIGDYVDLQPFWNSSDSYRVSFTLETDDWVRLSCTGAPKKAYASTSIGYVYLRPKTAGNTLLVVAPKLEYGSTATAYALNEDYPTEQEVGDEIQIGEAVTLGEDGFSTTEPGSTLSDDIRTVAINRGATKFISGDYLEGYIASEVSNDNSTGQPGIGIFYAHSTNKNAVGTQIARFGNTIDFLKRIWVTQGVEITYSTPFIDFHFNNTTTDYTARIIESQQSKLTVYNSISNASDKRLKKDIVDLDDSYTALIGKLEPKEYRFRRGDEYLYLGFVAQDVIEAMDELGIEDRPIVSGTGEGEDYYALDYTQFIPILVRKCQMQDERISKLEAEVEELKNLIKGLAHD